MIWPFKSSAWLETTTEKEKPMNPFQTSFPVGTKFQYRGVEMLVISTMADRGFHFPGSRLPPMPIPSPGLLCEYITHTGEIKQKLFDLYLLPFLYENASDVRPPHSRYQP